ncbi:hypothetical protein [Paracoccus sanguinis]|uniref:Uncharacterized protein n=1 Tax=Paracoccus sanguinis TaxID=1545044 RepID=A0A1H2W174_9RHOB|nr:hypothetical protein [Paracoccus sanguinis]SDW74422.1 hypothetical protein SAMN05444276_10210 [Paracoccus sanguinis]
MSAKWSRSEPKNLRPFWATVSLEDALAQATIELFRGDEPISDETKVLEKDQMQEMEPILRSHLDIAVLLAALGERASNYDLAVTIRTPQMMRRSLFGTWPLDENLPEEIELGAEPLFDAKLSGLVEIGVAIVCKGNANPEPGWPSQPGAWLARKTFTIGIDRRQSTFEFDLLTDEYLAQNNLFPGTALVVEVDTDLNVAVDDDLPFARILVTNATLEAIRAGKPSPAVRSMLYFNIMDAILEIKAADVDPVESIVAGSLLDRLTMWAGDGNVPMRASTFHEVCHSSLRRRSLVQSKVELSDALGNLR